jgi:hypothetical protein
MVAATALKLCRHDLPTNFHKNLPTGSEADRGGQTHRQDGDLITVFFPLEMKVG